MAGEDDARIDTDSTHLDTFEDESLRLKDALKSCRNVVASYRAMLAREENNDNPIDRDSEGEAQTT